MDLCPTNPLLRVNVQNCSKLPLVTIFFYLVQNFYRYQVKDLLIVQCPLHTESAHVLYIPLFYFLFRLKQMMLTWTMKNCSNIFIISSRTKQRMFNFNKLATYVLKLIVYHCWSPQCPPPNYITLKEPYTCDLQHQNMTVKQSDYNRFRPTGEGMSGNKSVGIVHYMNQKGTRCIFSLI